MEIVTEVRKPMNLRFEGGRQSETGLSTATFRRSFALISDDVADRISKALTAQALEESAAESPDV
jgi:hypothetical protein